jgi:hypothetical protein
LVVAGSVTSASVAGASGARASVTGVSVGVDSVAGVPSLEWTQKMEELQE